MNDLDWTALAQQALPYTALESITDPVSGLVDVTYCGLRTLLSEVLAKQPPGGSHSVAIFADTLVVDVPAIATTGLVLVVRNLDVSGLNGRALLLTPAADGDIVAQILLGATTGGALTLALSGRESAAVPVASGTAPLCAATYVATRQTGLEAAAPGDLASLIAYSWTMNSLFASFAAATWLMDNASNPPSRAGATAMLGWVTACTASLASNGQLPSDYAQLYTQAAALLVTLNVAPGAVYVPVLAPAYYSGHMNDIIGVLRDYENKKLALDTRQDIAQAIATVSASLQAVANIEIGPLQVQLDSIKANTSSLYTDINDLRGDFMLQSQRAHTAFVVMGELDALGKIQAQLSAELDMAMNTMSIGFNVAKMAESGDMDALKDAIQSSVANIKSLVEFIEAGKGACGDDLSSQATALLRTQSAMMQMVLNGRVLWQMALDNQGGALLPAALSGITIDTTVAWDNYTAAAIAEVDNLKLDLSADAQSAADTYLASLKILAGFGKAIGGKFVAYIQQLVRATTILAQIKAAKEVEARWLATQAAASSDAQKLVALKAVVQARMQSSKRSLYLAWTNYAASYFYLNFQAPPRVLHLDMDATALAAALVGVADWVASATASAPDGQHIQLPNTNAKIKLAFQVLPVGGQPGTGDTALLDKTADGGYTLTFTLPMGTSQLDGVLPNQGQCAIWITQAAFFLDGVTPNSKGNVIATVATSGTYQNGIGKAGSHLFVTKGLRGNFAYRPADKTVYSPWQIDTAVYITPTPYTQWSMTFAPGDGGPSTATGLTVEMTVAYMS